MDTQMRPSVAVALGALVDDTDYWRDRVPMWLSRRGFSIEAFSSYQALQQRLDSGAQFSFVLGDVVMGRDAQSGVEHLRELAERYPGKLGAVFMFTLKTKAELERFCEQRKLSTPFLYLYKGATTSEWDDQLKQAALPQTQPAPQTIRGEAR